MVRNRLREVRTQRDLSVYDVAPAVGIHPTMLSRIELGERGCRDSLKVRLAEFYGVGIEFLFFVRSDDNLSADLTEVPA